MNEIFILIIFVGLPATIIIGLLVYAIFHKPQEIIEDTRVWGLFHKDKDV